MLWKTGFCSAREHHPIIKQHCNGLGGSRNWHLGIAGLRKLLGVGGGTGSGLSWDFPTHPKEEISKSNGTLATTLGLGYRVRFHCRREIQVRSGSARTSSELWTKILQTRVRMTRVLRSRQVHSQSLLYAAVTEIRSCDHIYLVFSQPVVVTSSALTPGAACCAHANPPALRTPANGNVGSTDFSFMGKNMKECLDHASTLGYELASQSSSVMPPSPPVSIKPYLLLTVILRKTI